MQCLKKPVLQFQNNLYAEKFSSSICQSVQALNGRPIHNPRLNAKYLRTRQNLEMLLIRSFWITWLAIKSDPTYSAWPGNILSKTQILPLLAVNVESVREISSMWYAWTFICVASNLPILTILGTLQAERYPKRTLAFPKKEKSWQLHNMSWTIICVGP